MVSYIGWQPVLSGTMIDGLHKGPAWNEPLLSFLRVLTLQLFTDSEDTQLGSNNTSFHLLIFATTVLFTSRSLSFTPISLLFLRIYFFPLMARRVADSLDLPRQVYVSHIFSVLLCFTPVSLLLFLFVHFPPLSFPHQSMCIPSSQYLYEQVTVHVASVGMNIPVP